MEKKILFNSGRLMLESGYGTNKYYVEWQGDWSEKELIDYCDGGSCNFGGRLEDVVTTSDGISRGRVCVYYD